MPNTQANVSIALLYQTQELGRHMRDALASLGTPIVYEAPTAELDPAALESSGARVIVVNLDPEVEAHLDDVYDLLNDRRYSVVFNDAQVSSGLSGWDQARWTRHLAAKILGETDTDPPRPEDAEAIPEPEPVPEQIASAFDVAQNDDARDEAEESAEDFALDLASIPDAGMRPTVTEEPSEEAVEEVAEKRRDPLEMLDSRFDEMNRPVEAGFETTPPVPTDEFDFSTLEALTAAPAPPQAEPVEEIELASDTTAVEPEPEPRTSEGEEISMPEVGEFDLDALDRMLEGDAPVAAATPVDIADFGDLGDLGDLGDVGDVGNVADSGDETGVELAADIDEDLARDVTREPATASEDAEAPAIRVPDFTLSEMTDDEEPVAPKPAEPKPEPIKPTLAAAADWSLEDMLEGSEDEAPAAPAKAKASDFGIEKISPAEYLAPDTTDAEAPMPMSESDFSFELVPLEEAVAPQPVEKTTSEAWLDPDKVPVPPKIRRVWVLGASIGGPEAVREFLAELPRGYPALFLLAQHMGVEFVDLMAQQLARATELTVRTPEHGERVGHGEVVIVPTTHRLQVDPEGVILLERAPSDDAYSPSIDRVLRDVADRYGSQAGAIVFSGMTTDAVEGCAYLAGKGGVVYAQHPDTCVVSSMIDGVVESGVVKLLGTPKELAAKLIAETGKKK